MSLPSSDHTQGVNRSIEAEDSANAELFNPTIIENSADVVNQESLQTLVPQSFGSSPSVPSVSSVDAEYAGTLEPASLGSTPSARSMSPAIQENVQTLDSRVLNSNPSTPSAEASEQTCLETPGSAELLKSGNRSKVPDPVPALQRTDRLDRTADRYVLLDNFAHGGLGNLWRAEDTAIRREVAYKELLPKALKKPIQVERFIEEAQISGQLEHPGIIPIYDVGVQENGAPFYTMKLVRGGNMEEAIEAMHKLPRGSSERQLAFNRLLRQFIAICQAVGFAHEKGVLHRDLKPLNVMVGEFGETLVLDWGLAKLMDLIGEQSISSDRSRRPTPDGQGFVVDGESEVATVVTDDSEHPDAPNDSAARFPLSPSTLGATQGNAPNPFAAKGPGTAKAETKLPSSKTYNAATSTMTGQRPVQTGMRSAGSETQMGQVMGTPAYMSPEQALGQIDELDSRTDIYSLGAILYKLLSNQQPYGRGKIQEVLDKVIAGLLPPPRAIDPAIPKPLEAICLKAMSKDKMDRYPKALDLAADVEAWLADQPVSAYPDPWLERARRWAKQHRTLVVSSTATTLVILVSIFFAERAAANRLNRRRIDANTKIKDAQIAKTKSDFVEAEKLLNAAAVIVDSEPKLVSEREEIKSEIAAVARVREAAVLKRVESLREDADLELDRAQRAILEDQDYPRAKLILTEIAERLATEPLLSELEQTARSRFKAVDQFESFVKEVELAQIFGGNISGDESLDDIREAKRHAVAALEIFEIDFDQPDKAGPRLRVLGETAISKWRDKMEELLVSVAYLETKLALHDNEGEVRAAAQRGLDHLLQAERLGLTSKALSYLRADLYSGLDQRQEAQQARKVAESLPSKTRLDFYLLGELARAQGQYAEAIAAYQDALRVDPDDFWSLNMLGLCNVQLRQYEAAIASYTACIAQRPRFHWPYLTRGVAFGNLQRFSAAHQDFAKAVELDGESYHVFLNRGAVSYLQQNYEAAQADFQKASQLKPEQAAPYINLALAHYERADQIQKTSQAANADVLAKAEYQQALAALTAATKHSPRQAGIYALRGSIHLALGDLDVALSELDRALQLETNAVRRGAHFKQIGLIHSRAGRLPEAVSAYDRSLAKNPDDSDVIRWRAEAAMRLEHFDEAVKGFTAFLGKAGPVADIYQARATALTKLGRYGEAINDYTMFLQLAPQNEQSAQMLALRGRAYLSEANKLGKADFEEAIRLNPRNPNHFHGLARARVLLGDYVEAIAILEQSNPLNRQVIEQVGAKAWSFLYNPATVYSQASAKVLLDAKLPLEQREKLAKQYAQRAVVLLLEAHQLAGPQFQSKLSDYVRTDSELDPIRQTPEFLEALKSLNRNSDQKSDAQKPDPLDRQSLPK